MLTNEVIENVMLNSVGLGIGQEIRVKNLWAHLVHSGYREDMIRFMEVLEVRFPKEPYLDPETLANALGSTSTEDLTETRFRVTKTHLAPVGDWEALDDKGKYQMEFYGIHFMNERNAWADKATMLFSIKLN